MRSLRISVVPKFSRLIRRGEDKEGPRDIQRRPYVKMEAESEVMLPQTRGWQGLQHPSEARRKAWGSFAV